jgi:hypothetical protein
VLLVCCTYHGVQHVLLPFTSLHASHVLLLHARQLPVMSRSAGQSKWAIDRVVWAQANQMDTMLTMS